MSIFVTFFKALPGIEDPGRSEIDKEGKKDGMKCKLLHKGTKWKRNL